MALCDNAFCAEELAECSQVALAGRQFCCIACADDWRRQNEALIEAAAPFHIPAFEAVVGDLHAGLSSGRRGK